MSTIDTSIINIQRDTLGRLAEKITKGFMELYGSKPGVSGLMYFAETHELQLPLNESGELLSERIVVDVHMVHLSNDADLTRFVTHVKMWTVQEVPNDRSDLITFSRYQGDELVPANVSDILNALNV